MYELQKTGISIRIDDNSDYPNNKIMHTFDDFKLLMVSQNIETPEQIKKIIEVPGAPNDGIDATFFVYDYPIYKRRKATWKFVYFSSSKEFESYKNIMTQLNIFISGNRCHIRCDDDVEYEYYGYLSIRTGEYNGDYLEIEIEGDLAPYKTKECHAIFSQKGEYWIDTGIAPTLINFPESVDKEPEEATKRYHLLKIDDELLNLDIFWRYHAI